MSTQNFEQMQWSWLEGLLSGWRWRLRRTVGAPCPPEFSCTDQGWRVNSEDVSPTHQSNITPVEPRGEAKSVSTFFSWFSCEDFSRYDYENQKNISTSHLTFDPKKVKDETLAKPRKWGETSWTDWSTTPKVVKFQPYHWKYIKWSCWTKKKIHGYHPENLLHKNQENSQILSGCSAAALLFFYRNYWAGLGFCCRLYVRISEGLATSQDFSFTKSKLRICIGHFII